VKNRSAIEDLLEMALKNPVVGIVCSVILAGLGLYLTNKQAPVGAKPSETLFLPMMHMFGTISYFIAAIVLIVAGIGFVAISIKRKRLKPSAASRTWKDMVAPLKSSTNPSASMKGVPRFKTREEYFRWKDRVMQESSDNDSAVVTSQGRTSQVIEPCYQVNGLKQEQCEALTVEEDATAWTTYSIYDALSKVDWYQFEKFSATLLRSEGYAVERKGGAHPDGGVDLIAMKDGEIILVQCKHWKTWDIKPKTVREMIGTMKINDAAEGAIYTLKGATPQAQQLANEQKISIIDGRQLANRALLQISNEELDNILKADIHHCPKCEAPMIWREGSFKAFWGCSRYPRCRGKLEYAGAR
jgi:hypothetical protein